jgi:hydroxymethylpyrimidine pyrophosphatase-like HAD family hydrolase
MMINNVIFDLDGTLCNDKHRNKYAEEKRWDEYHALCYKDIPNKDVAGFMRVCSKHVPRVLIMTGRPCKYRENTLKWLEKYDLVCDTLIMRPENNFDSNFELKLGFVKAFYGSLTNARQLITMMLEDNARTIKHFRDYGFNVWACENE